MLLTLGSWVVASAAWTLFGAGCALGAWALFWDRARGRRRCPRCWYDMAGTAGLLCPECGKVALRAKLLKSTRRRWRWAGVGGALVVAAYGVRATPDVTARGWVAATPNVALIAATPLFEADFGPATAKRSIAGRMFREAMWRVSNHRFRSWELDLLVRRSAVLSRGPETQLHSVPAWFLIDAVAAAGGMNRERTRLLCDAWAPGAIRTRPVWVAGEPMYAKLQAPPAVAARGAWRSFTAQIQAPGSSQLRVSIDDPNTLSCFRSVGWGDGLSVALVCPAEPGEVKFPVEMALSEQGTLGSGAPAREIWRGAAAMPIRLVSDADEVMTAAHLPEIEAALIRTLEPRLMNPRRGCYQLSLCQGLQHFADVIELPEGITFGVDLVIECDGKPALQGSVWWVRSADPARAGVVHSYPTPAVSIPMEALDGVDLNARSWTLRVRSNPIVAMRNFDSDRYWKGEVVVPMKSVPLMIW